MLLFELDEMLHGERECRSSEDEPSLNVEEAMRLIAMRLASDNALIFHSTSEMRLKINPVHAPLILKGKSSSK